MQLLDQQIEEIKQLEQNLCYEVMSPPFTINNFSLWRDIKFRSMRNIIMQQNPDDDDDNGFKQQLKVMKYFISQVDEDLYRRFQYKIHNFYLIQLQSTSKFDNLQSLKIDEKQLKDLFQNELKQQQKQIIQITARLQLELENTYDLLKRLQLYNLTNLNSNDILGSINTYTPKENNKSIIDQCLESLSSKLITTTQTISSSTIKDNCSSHIMPHSFVEGGKSMLRNSIKLGESSWKYIADFNVTLFIGGLVADKIVEKVSWKILVKSVEDKLEEYIMKTNKQINEMIEKNNKLDKLIWQAYFECENENEFEYKKQQIQIFLQKYYHIDQTHCNLIYCAETNKSVNIREEDDFVIIQQQVIEFDSIEDSIIIQAKYHEQLTIDPNYLQ